MYKYVRVFTRGHGINIRTAVGIRKYTCNYIYLYMLICAIANFNIYKIIMILVLYIYNVL